MLISASIPPTQPQPPKPSPPRVSYPQPVNSLDVPSHYQYQITSSSTHQVDSSVRIPESYYLIQLIPRPQGTTRPCNRENSRFSCSLPICSWFYNESKIKRKKGEGTNLEVRCGTPPWGMVGVKSTSTFLPTLVLKEFHLSKYFFWAAFRSLFNCQYSYTDMGFPPLMRASTRGSRGSFWTAMSRRISSPPSAV